MSESPPVVTRYHWMNTHPILQENVDAWQNGDMTFAQMALSAEKPVPYEVTLEAFHEYANLPADVRAAMAEDASAAILGIQLAVYQSTSVSE